MHPIFQPNLQKHRIVFRLQWKESNRSRKTVIIYRSYITVMLKIG